MDPMSMISGLASAAMPLATKAMEMGAGMLKEMMKGAGQQKPGEDTQAAAPAKIEF
ncbi:hypothetical protein ACI77F_15810 [Pseudomonas tritici]|uniref:hypothetical protein n=1 Tax=Pseudomonas tritici TaxID=2745518 RepID=UPI00387A93C1